MTTETTLTVAVTVVEVVTMLAWKEEIVEEGEDMTVEAVVEEEIVEVGEAVVAEEVEIISYVH